MPATLLAAIYFYIDQTISSTSEKVALRFGSLDPT